MYEQQKKIPRCENKDRSQIPEDVPTLARELQPSVGCMGCSQVHREDGKHRNRS